MTTSMEITLHCVHNDNAPFSIVIKSNDNMKALYTKVYEHLSIKEGSIDLTFNNEVIKCDETKLEETTLQDGDTIYTEMSVMQKAQLTLKSMNIEWTPKALCEASAEGDCVRIKLLLDAGVDVNCTMPENN